MTSSCFSSNCSDLIFLFQRKSRDTPVRRVDHVAGKNNELRNGKALIEEVRAALEMPGQHSRLLSGGRECVQIVAGCADRRPIRLLCSIQVSQDNQRFSDGCVSPIVLRLGLANFQNSASQSVRLVCLFKKESDRRCVDSGVEIGRFDFKGAVVAIERLPQGLLIGWIRAPLVLVGSAQNAQCFPVRRLLRGQRCENGLSANGRTHLSQRQRHSLFEPVVVRMKLADGRCRPHRRPIRNSPAESARRTKS